jgi:Shwachman-Bodian-Diamond syndrome (SBDS) protein
MESHLRQFLPSEGTGSAMVRLRSSSTTPRTQKSTSTRPSTTPRTHIAVESASHSEDANIQLLNHRHGAQGVLDAAPKQMLDNEFGTSNEDEVMIKILEGGELQHSEVRDLSILGFWM